MTDPEVAAGIGAGWVALVRRAQEELTARDPAARIDARLSPLGLLELRVRGGTLSRADRRAFARRHADAALGICEACGGRGRVLAGAVLRVACGGCG